MGCDIHLHVEFLVEGAWYHYNHPLVERDYRLFGKMAGVRNVYEEDAIAQPRGLPTDATFTTRFDAESFWAPDGHSHSYLTSEEVACLDEWHKPYRPLRDIFGFERLFGFFFGNSYPRFRKFRDDYPAEVEDFRFVFWFDN